MPVVFDIVGLVNNVREPVNHDGDDLEDNPFVTDEDNPLLRMDSIGQGSPDRFVPAGPRFSHSKTASDHLVLALTGYGPEIPFKGLIEEANEDTDATSEGSEEVEQEEDSETEDKIENRKFLMAWNVRPISVKNLGEEKIQNFEEIEDELKIELSKFW